MTYLQQRQEIENLGSNLVKLISELPKDEMTFARMNKRHYAEIIIRLGKIYNAINNLDNMQEILKNAN